MRIAWMSDIHLDFLDDAAIAELGASVAGLNVDAAVITGDISIAPELIADLTTLIASWEHPAYFVCGNHDYYRASIEAVRRGLREVNARQDRLRWLPACGVVRLNESTALVGIDGWADGRAGSPETTPIVLNDHLHIEELVQPTRAELLEVVRALGDEEAASLRRVLGEAFAPVEHVVVATHIPPFIEACMHEGKKSSDDWLPWMCCTAVGDVLMEMAGRHPDRRVTVLAGHTHARVRVGMRDNLEVRTAGVEYGAPKVEAVLEL